MARPSYSRRNDRAGSSGGRKPDAFVYAERAAALATCAERYAWIDREVPENWRDITLATLPHFVVARINEQRRNRQEHNRLIDDAMNYRHHRPSWAGKFIVDMTDENRDGWGDRGGPFPSRR